MGRMSMSLALVALLAVAGTTYAARPIDVTTDAESIQPMNLLEEQVVADASRELQSSHTYPPPPPLADFQGQQNRPVIEQGIALQFNNSQLAQNFSDAVGGTIRCSQGGDCSQDDVASRKLLSNHESPKGFAEDYLVKTLEATQNSGVTAEDGIVTVSVSAESVNMAVTLYYPEGTTQQQLEDEISDDLAVSTRDVTSFNEAQWENFQQQYGIRPDFALSDLTDQATDAGNFTPTEDPDGDGAQGLQASLLMGVAVVLSAFLLA